MVTLELGFDGCCPQSRAGVRAEGGNAFTVFPSWRREPGWSEDGIGRTTRLGFRLRNKNSAPQQATVHVDWQYHQAPPDALAGSAIDTCDKYMALRDFCVVQYPGSPEWQYRPGKVRDSVATFDLALPPGVTEVHWHPPYSYAQGEAFIAGLQNSPGVVAETLGATPGKRNLWLIRVRDETRRPGRRFLVTARMHAYESGGSYAMEGMVRFLLEDTPEAGQARRDWEFFIVPMVNPDGVADGLGKLTRPGGTDLQWLLSDDGDPVRNLLKDLVDRVRPAYYCDLHNWQFKDVDGVIDMDDRRWERFRGYMPPAATFGKEWLRLGSGADKADLSGRERVHFRQYCATKYHCPTVTFEPSWFGRQPEHVRAFGREALRTILRVEREEP